MTTAGSDSLATGGFRMPAEWERHDATWIAWPHNRTDWPGKLAPIPWVYGEITRKLATHEKVRILVDTPALETQARRVLEKTGTPLQEVEFFRIVTNRTWLRDFGPIYVRRIAPPEADSAPPEADSAPPSDLAIAGFRFNAWAKYDDYQHDCRVAERIAKATRCPLIPATFQGRGFVLEGGSIDVNGRGSLLTTEECLLDKETQARNPKAGRADIEAVLKDSLGAVNVLWLHKGIVGDDTHGHIDDLCRFVGPTTVVICRETNAADDNYRALEENRELLEGFRAEDGSRLQVAFLPMPAPLVHAGQRLPASYANFYVANGTVIVPTFNDPNDRTALGVLADLFPGRTVVGIHAVDLVWGLGTLHCLSQQMPAAG
jgi:agmatine deiminase